MVHVEPIPIEVPPVAAVNQLIVPAEDVALRDTDPAPHTLPGVVPVREGV